MPKNLIITYTAGSCGDLISVPWVATNQFYSLISHHTITENGRALATFNEKFIEQFPKQPYLHHYTRDWSNDLDSLKNLSTPFLILTTLSEQARLIKNHFQDDVHVISINYNSSNWPFVAKSFCSKVLDSPDYLTKDDVGEKFLNSVAKTLTQREQFLYLGKKGLLGLWYAKHLALGQLSYPPKENNFTGDTTLLLDEIFNFDQLKNKLDIAAIDVEVTLNLESFAKIHSLWHSKQFQITDIDKALFTQGH